MRNDLYRLTQILTAPLLLQHVPVHLARCQVGILVEVLINETLIMTKVQVRLRTVLRHEHFAMLIR